MTINKFYTYAYLREDKTPYYIGKGKDRRAYRKHKNVKVPKNINLIIILKNNLTEKEAFKHEAYMIAILGRIDNGTGILENKTNGGEGCPGYIYTEEYRKKLSENIKGENNPFYGRKHTDETKQKIRELNIGKKLLEETKEKIKKSMTGENNPNYGKRGKKHTEGWKKNHSDAMSGEKNPFYGQKHTEENKKKMSEKKRGPNHRSAKKYILTNPEGLEYVVIGELEIFCKKNQISYSTMRLAAQKKQTTPRSNGWSIRELIITEPVT
jgi:hypothetical protein